MPERPLILLGTPEIAARANRNGGPNKINFPSHSRQVDRLSPQLSVLQSVWDREEITFTRNAGVAEIEYSLVIETINSVDSFFTAVKKLNEQGFILDILSDIQPDDIDSDDDFYVVDKQGNKQETKQLSRKIYCVLANHAAMKQMLNLWNNYSANVNYKFPHGLSGLKNVFSQLKRIRLWNESDRFFDTGIIEDWNESIAQGDSTCRCEIELFYIKSLQTRYRKLEDIKAIIVQNNGEILAESIIDEIKYHAILVDIPVSVAKDMINHANTDLVKASEIMYINPQSQTSVIIESNGSDQDVPSNLNNLTIKEEPIVALFDGFPQSNHELLRDLLIVDDPDGYEPQCIVEGRKHGTAMASLILRSDLSNQNLIARKIYVRPIMITESAFRGGYEESVPKNVLLVDKIHEAVRRLFEQTAGKVAPTIKVINLSIGIRNKVFYYTVSPLAKLLDWLSFKYKILFIVSAGNHGEDVSLKSSFSVFKTKNLSDKSSEVISFLNDSKNKKRLLSPAESMNSVTVGARFFDESTYNISYSTHTQLCANNMPSPISAFGKGINQSIKRICRKFYKV